MAKKSTNRIWFDIETTGVGRPVEGLHFYESSILQIAWAGEKGIAEEVIAGRAPSIAGFNTDRMSIWSHEKVWEPLKRKTLTKAQKRFQTEEAILGQFIKQLELNTGAELIGWNIGYTPEVIDRQQALRGYDVAGLMTRAARYGMQDQMGAALKGVKLRDIGTEFAVRLVQGMFDNIGRVRLEEMVSENKLDKDIYKQALGFQKQLNIMQQFYGQKGPEDVARAISRSGTMLSGWSQDVARQLFIRMYGEDKLAQKLFENWNQDLKPSDADYKSLEDMKGFVLGKQAHQADIDAAIARLLTDPVEELTTEKRTQEAWELIAEEWGAIAERNKAVGRIKSAEFEGAKIHEVLTGEWFGKLKADPSLGEKFEKDFWTDLAEAAEEKYGKEQLPDSAKNWEEVLKGLKPDEDLVEKFGLIKEKRWSEFGPKGLLASIAEKTAKRYEFARTAKVTIESLLDFSSKVLGKGGRIGVTALAASVALGPLQVFGTEADDYKQRMAGYWQHVLLGQHGDTKIPGHDDLYNTVKGLPTTGFAHFNRPTHSDFGSGWIPAHGNSYLLSDPGFNLEGNFEAMRRVQEATADEKITSDEYNKFIRALTFDQDTNLASYLANDYTYAGRAMGYLGRAIATTPQDPDEIFGVRIDPTVMDFRREVLQNSDKRAAFKEELATKQRAALERLGRFDRADLMDVDLTNYKEMALEASNMRAVNLGDFVMEVEDADTLILKRKGLFNFFDKDISIRLSGVDAPETGGHTGDPLEEMGARIQQEQPYGQRSAQDLKDLIAESGNLELLVSAEPQTYGRYTGVLFGEMGGAERDDINSWGDFGKSEQVNLNMELLRRGSVAALPFGSQQSDMINRHNAKKAEDEAADHEVGMWQYTRYKAHRHMSELLKNSITFNTFTQRQKLADNLDLAAYASYLQSMGSTRRDLKRADKNLLKNMGGTLKRHGFSGRKRPDYMKGYRKSGRTYKSFTPPAAADYGTKQTFQRKIPIPRSYPKGDDDFYNTIEGFGHTGQAYTGRQRTDFGSGWDRNKAAGKIQPFEAGKNTGDTYSPEPSRTTAKRSAAQFADQAKKLQSEERNVERRQGVHTSTTEITMQVGRRMDNQVLSDKQKAVAKFTPPLNTISPKTKKPVISRKVDNARNPNIIKDNIRRITPQEIAAKNKRRMKFINAHAQSLVRASNNGLNSGKRSKMGRGADRLVV